MTPALIAEHPDWLALHKPAGVSMHSEDGAGLVVQYQHWHGAPLWPVHRLDRDTSGVLLLARSAAAAATFGQLFQQRRVEKFYLGLSAQRPHRKMGVVAGDMTSGRNGNQRLLHTLERPAVTSFLSAAGGRGGRLLLMRPWTGRTHQLRVAMKAEGAPLRGDRRYGGVAAEHLCLHAWGVRFAWQGQWHQLQAPLPASPWYDDVVVQQQCGQWWPPFALTMPRPADTLLRRIGSQ